MDLTNILTTFFKSHGSLFTIMPNSEQFYGRLSPRTSSNSGKVQITPLGKGIVGEYELVTSGTVLGLAKGVTLECDGKSYIITDLNEYLLNSKPLYLHVVLHKLGAVL